MTQFKPSTVSLINSNHLRLSETVLTALSKGDPVVALESTIITHGMPYPDNYKTAQSVEQIIRDQGAVPATIAIIDGIMHVGLTNEELMRLSIISRDNPKSVEKCTRRTLPFVLSKHLHGSTTVAATMYIANLVGIKVFVTGGIGGVHRGVADTWDISADLTELGSTPVTVICAGVKSILDIPKTLEYLETQGVNVVTLGQSNFPAFFVSDSGHASPLRLDRMEEVAEMIYISDKLGLRNGNLVAVPVGSGDSASFEVIERATKQALSELEKFGIKGRDVTPYLLKRVNELTGGVSLKSNIALIKNNARNGAVLARSLQQIRASQGVTPKQDVNGMNSKSLNSLKSLDALVIGGICNDVIATVHAAGGLKNETSNPGVVKYGIGGVGRNIAECLARLGMVPKLVSVVGNDVVGESILRNCATLGIDTKHVLKTGRHATSSYIALHGAGGDLHCAVADLSGLESCLTVDYFESVKIRELIQRAPFVVLDANLCKEPLEYLTLQCDECGVPTWFEPISVEKCVRIVKNDGSGLNRVTYMSPNLLELYALMKALKYSGPIETNVVDIKLLERYGKFVCGKGCENLLITLGKDGVLVVCRNGFVKHFAAVTVNEKDVVSTNGAGDTLTGGVVAGLLRNETLINAVKMGLQAARMSIGSNHAVAPDMTLNKLKAAVMSKL